MEKARRESQLDPLSESQRSDYNRSPTIITKATRKPLNMKPEYFLISIPESYLKKNTY